MRNRSAGTWDGGQVEKLVRGEVRRLMERPVEGMDLPMDDAVSLEVPPGGYVREGF